MSDQFVDQNPATAGYHSEGGGVRQSIRDRIASVAPYTKRIIRVDAWDVDVEVRSLTLGERNDMIAKANEAGNGQDISVIYPEMIKRTAYDPETGEKVFSEDDTAFINSMPASVMDKLAVPAMELSGMKDDAVDESAKKSSETEASDSAS